MDLMTAEVLVGDPTTSETSANLIAEIADLQLLLIGGGIGDTQL